ncbi:hypothetical protein [Anaeromyxobacter oryzae]|nr:hypothetical protein [Anaeromyxobacter oryzae]
MTRPALRLTPWTPMLNALLLAAFLVAPDAEARPEPTPVDAAVEAGVPVVLARDVAARAEARGVDPAAALAPVASAARAGVPSGPVAAKVLEGLAKGVPAERVLAVAGALADRLGRAGALLDRAAESGLAIGPDLRIAALADLADAMAAGVSPETVLALVDAARAAGGRADAAVAAARTLGELARRGVPVADATPLAVALAKRPPLPPGEIAALYEAYRREGGDAPGPFLDEARGRIARGEPLADVVDHFGESPDHVNHARQAGGPAAAPGAHGRAVGRPEPGAVPGVEGEPRGRGNSNKGGRAR